MGTNMGLAKKYDRANRLNSQQPLISQATGKFDGGVLSWQDTPLRKSYELQYMQRQLLQSSPLPYNKNYTSQKNDAVSTLLSAGPSYYLYWSRSKWNPPFAWVNCLWNLLGTFRATIPGSYPRKNVPFSSMFLLLQMNSPYSSQFDKSQMNLQILKCSIF